MPRKHRILGSADMTQEEIDEQVRKHEQAVADACDAQEQFTDDELEESCLAQEIEQGKIEEAEDEARCILSLIQGLSYAEQVKALGKHLLPFIAVMLTLIMFASTVSGCASRVVKDSPEYKHLQSFKQGDIIVMNGQPDYKFTIEDCNDIGWGNPSTHAEVCYFDEWGELHQLRGMNAIDLRLCKHAE